MTLKNCALEGIYPEPRICGMVTTSMWNKGSELGMKMYKGFNACSSCSPALLPN
jgi:hypothetical protein